MAKDAVVPEELVRAGLAHAPEEIAQRLGDGVLARARPVSITGPTESRKGSVHAAPICFRKVSMSK